MSLKKNISGGELDVPLLGRSVGDGETVEVPDFQPAHNPESSPGDPDYLAIVWPPDKWQHVEAPAGTRAALPAGDGTSTEGM
jgi:hypothetical protein